MKRTKINPTALALFSSIIVVAIISGCGPSQKTQRTDIERSAEAFVNSMFPEDKWTVSGVSIKEPDAECLLNSFMKEQDGLPAQNLDMTIKLKKYDEKWIVVDVSSKNFIVEGLMTFRKIRAFNEQQDRISAKP